MGVREVRGRLQHAPQLGDGELEVAGLEHEVGEVEARLGLLGVEGQRRLEPLAGRRHVAASVGEAAQVRVRGGEPRVERQGLAVTALGAGVRVVAADGLDARPLDEPLVGAARAPLGRHRGRRLARGAVGGRHPAGELAEAEGEHLLAGRLVGAPLVDDHELGAVEGDADPVERPVEVRQRRPHLLDRSPDLRGLEPALGQLLGRLDADEVLERIDRLAGPPAGGSHEPDLGPVAQLALGDVEDLRRVRERVHRLVAGRHRGRCRGGCPCRRAHPKTRPRRRCR